MQEQLNEMKKEQAECAVMIKEIRDHLVGTKLTNDKGLVHAVHQNTRFRRMSGWYAGAIAGLVFGAKSFWIYVKTLM